MLGGFSLMETLRHDVPITPEEEPPSRRECGLIPGVSLTSSPRATMAEWAAEFEVLSDL